MWYRRWEGSLQEDALCLHHVGPGSQAQVDKPGGRCLWWLSCPSLCILTLLNNSWMDSVSGHQGAPPLKPWFGT